MGLIDRILSLLGLRTSPSALTRKGLAYQAREDVVHAAENFKKALAADSLYVPAYDALGKMYFRMGLRDEADREFAIADGLEKLAKDPTNIDAAIKMGRAMMEKRLHKEAASLLEPVFKHHPRHSELMKILGLCYKTLGVDKRARELLKAGIERWPRDAEFYQHLGSLELKAGKKEEGERLVNIARLMNHANTDPTDSESRAQLGRLFYSRNLFADAADYLRQALAINSSKGEYWTFLGDCYIKAGQYPAAVDAYKKATVLTPADARPHQSMAQAFQLMGRFDESRAAKEVAKVLEGGQSETKNPQQGAKYVKYLLSIGKTDDAEKSLEEMLEKWPDSFDLKVILGRVLLKNQQNDRAVSVLKEVADAKEKWAEPRILLAMAFQRIGDKMSALAEGQLATRLAPKSHTAHKVLGDILREQGKFSMAENAYETAEHLKPSKKDK